MASIILILHGLELHIWMKAEGWAWHNFQLTFVSPFSQPSAHPPLFIQHWAYWGSVQCSVCNMQCEVCKYIACNLDILQFGQIFFLILTHIFYNLDTLWLIWNYIFYYAMHCMHNAHEWQKAQLCILQIRQLHVAIRTSIFGNLEIYIL